MKFLLEQALTMQTLYMKMITMIRFPRKLKTLNKDVEPLRGLLMEHIKRNLSRTGTRIPK